jgi:hypothetical protein
MILVNDFDQDLEDDLDYFYNYRCGYFLENRIDSMVYQIDDCIDNLEKCSCVLFYLTILIH